MAMAIKEEDLQSIGAYVQDHFAEFARNSGIAVTDRTVLDRILVVEQELKSQRDLMQQGFQAMERRFEATDKRFEAMDKRFEAMDKRFEDLQRNMDKRFEAVDKRFEDQQHNMDKRFEAVDKRFEDLQRNMDKRFNATQWFIGAGFTIIVVLMSIYQFVAS